MKIRNKSAISRCTFECLNEGDVFDSKGDYVMKTDEIISKDGEIVNAVFLESGYHGVFYGHEEVIPIKCELVIE